jgi:FAD/FMN-containing dehydrogenase
VSLVEVMGRFALELVAKHMPQFRIPLFDQDVPYWVLIECSDTESEEHARGAFERLLEAAFEAGWVSDAVIAESLSQAAQMWDIREHIALAQGKEGPNVKHDISIPISTIPAFVSATEAQLAAVIPGVRIINFGHLGDGNLHFNVQCPEGADGGDFLVNHEAEITNLAYQCVDAFDGSFSAEHGVGAVKVEKLQQYKCPAALRLMKSIKLAVDPLNIMNPGRVLPSAD